MIQCIDDNKILKIQFSSIHIKYQHNFSLPSCIFWIFLSRTALGIFFITSRYSGILEEFGVSKSTIWCFQNVFFALLKCSLKHLWDLIVVYKTTKKKDRWVISKKVVKNKSWPKTYLLKDKEAYIVATSEIYDAHGLPKDIVRLTNELQQVFHGIIQRSIGNGIQTKYVQSYAYRFIKYVNR